jgi:hypothetical protein
MLFLPLLFARRFHLDKCCFSRSLAPSPTHGKITHPCNLGISAHVLEHLRRRHARAACHNGSKLCVWQSSSGQSRGITADAACCHDGSTNVSCLRFLCPLLPCIAAAPRLGRLSCVFLMGRSPPYVSFCLVTQHF